MLGGRCPLSGASAGMSASPELKQDMARVGCSSQRGQGGVPSGYLKMPLQRGLCLSQHPAHVTGTKCTPGLDPPRAWLPGLSEAARGFLGLPFPGTSAPPFLSGPESPHLRQRRAGSTEETIQTRVAARVGGAGRSLSGTWGSGLRSPPWARPSALSTSLQRTCQPVSSCPPALTPRASFSAHTPPCRVPEY